MKGTASISRCLNKASSLTPVSALAANGCTGEERAHPSRDRRRHPLWARLIQVPVEQRQRLVVQPGIHQKIPPRPSSRSDWRSASLAACSIGPVTDAAAAPPSVVWDTADWRPDGCWRCHTFQLNPPRPARTGQTNPSTCGFPPLVPNPASPLPILTNHADADGFSQFVLVQ